MTDEDIDQLMAELDVIAAEKQAQAGGMETPPTTQYGEPSLDPGDVPIDLPPERPGGRWLYKIGIASAVTIALGVLFVVMNQLFMLFPGAPGYP